MTDYQSKLHELFGRKYDVCHQESKMHALIVVGHDVVVIRRKRRSFADV